jgi:hypothetical protein
MDPSPEPASARLPRRLDQLLDNLGATQIVLPDEQMTRLSAAAEPDLGFPGTFIKNLVVYLHIRRQATRFV